MSLCCMDESILYMYLPSSHSMSLITDDNNMLSFQLLVF